MVINSYEIKNPANKTFSIQAEKSLKRSIETLHRTRTATINKSQPIKAPIGSKIYVSRLFSN